MTRTTLDLSEEERQLLKNAGDGSLIGGVRKLISKYGEEMGIKEGGEVLRVPDGPKLEEIYRRLIDNSEYVEEGVRVIRSQDAVVEVSRLSGISKNGAKNRLDELEKKGFCKLKSGWKPRIYLFLEYEKIGDQNGMV